MPCEPVITKIIALPRQPVLFEARVLVPGTSMLQLIEHYAKSARMRHDMWSALGTKAYLEPAA